jgi:pyrroloquinoline-quinone synthase
MLAHYPWVTADTLAYFTPRLTQAPKDSDFALQYVREHADNHERQQQVLAALRFKCDVLWAQLDALYYAYVAPKLVPPGAFLPNVR